MRHAVIIIYYESLFSRAVIRATNTRIPQFIHAIQNMCSVSDATRMPSDATALRMCRMAGNNGKFVFDEHRRCHSVVAGDANDNDARSIRSYEFFTLLYFT